jgi:hypothetical protein
VIRFPLVAYALLLASGAASGLSEHASKPKNGNDLIAQMRDRYHGKWYRTLTFTQRTTLPDGKVETWYEALELPGKLRIDIAPLDSMKTIIFDVYEAPVSETVTKLQNLKFDLSKLYQTKWRGRSTYVVGAAQGDTTSPQFWIDAERLYFVRSFEPSKKDPAVINETRFEKYIPLAGGWLEMEVLFLANGKQRVKEEYSNPKANVKLDPAIFDPRVWKAPGWVK